MATKGTLFAKAKQTAPKAEKKSDKVIIPVSGDEFDFHLNKIVQLEAQIDQLTAELEISKGIVKEIGSERFNERYSQTGGYPGSFNLSSDSGASIMFVPMDKYLKCDEARGEELKEAYCSDLVTEKTEYIINPTLVEKYAEPISAFIETSPDISDDDRGQIIQAKVSYSVTKGAIEKAYTWGKGQVAPYIRDIQPIFSLKSPTIKKATF
jgi:hypothetical protein